MNGKSKCKILKDIRRQIAQDNDIEYITSECKFQGECSGTCPKCESELRYLENELAKRRKAGKAIAVAGIAAALVVASSGCTPDKPAQPNDLQGDLALESMESQSQSTEIEAGKVVLPTDDELTGEPPITEPSEETCETLLGDVDLDYYYGTE